MYKLIRPITLLFCLFYSIANAQQITQPPDLQPPNNEDSFSSDDYPNYTNYQFYDFVLFTGGGVMFPFHSSSGAVGLGFPYTSTDATTGIIANNVFQSKRGTVIYNKVKPYWIPLLFEAGGLKHFFSIDFSAGSGQVDDIALSTGYGFLWYFNGLGEHEKNIVNKRFMFKASINIAWNQYGGLTSLGTIDNSNRTINLLGHTAPPTFDITTTDDNGNSETDTYTAKNLNVYYKQTDWLLMPKISIGNNPYRGKWSKRYPSTKQKILWDFSLGYNIPIINKGGIQLVQDDGKGDTQNLINSLISLKTPNATFLYNGKQITSSPFRLSSLYISFSIRYNISWYH